VIICALQLSLLTYLLTYLLILLESNVIEGSEGLISVSVYQLVISVLVLTEHGASCLFAA